MTPIEMAEKLADLELENKRLRDAFAALSVQRDDAEEHGRSFDMLTRLLQFDVATMSRTGRGISWVGISLGDFAALRMEQSLSQRYSVQPADAKDASEMTLATPSGLMRIVAVPGLSNRTIAELSTPMVVLNSTRIHSMVRMSRDTMEMVRCDYRIEPMQAARVEIE